MFITILLILYIILSHIYFIIKYGDLKIKNNDLKIKYDPKQWVNGIVTPLVRGMIAGYYTNSGKYKNNYC